MGVCEKCGKNIGILEILNSTSTEADSNLCRGCYKASIKDLENQKLEEERHQRFKELNLNELIRKKLASSGKMVLYKKIYIPVDSTINAEKLAESFDISLVQEVAINDWEIVSTVSKTKGILHRVAGGEAWGIGGNIEGVYFIMRKEITAADIPLSDDELVDCFMG